MRLIESDLEVGSGVRKGIHNRAHLRPLGHRLTVQALWVLRQ